MMAFFQPRAGEEIEALFYWRNIEVFAKWLYVQLQNEQSWLHTKSKQTDNLISVELHVVPCIITSVLKAKENVTIIFPTVLDDIRLIFVDQLTGSTQLSILKKRKKQNWVPHIPTIESLYL